MGTTFHITRLVQTQEAGRKDWFTAPKCPHTLYLVLTLTFLSACFIGYFNHQTPQQEPISCDSQQEVKGSGLVQASLEWDDIVSHLAQKLTRNNLDMTMSEFNLFYRLAGSSEDMLLQRFINKEFMKHGMEPWTDRHYIRLPSQDSLHPNRVLVGSEVFQPKGFLAYSPTGTTQGKVVYGNYGRPEDLVYLQKNNIELKGCVMLLRAGLISFAQQVFNAAESGASGVLIYPDPASHNYRADTELYGHIHLGSGDPYTPGFPSFNHTLFRPTQSSGLPSIPAQTLTTQMAAAVFKVMGGPAAEEDSGFRGGLVSVSYRLGGVVNVTLEVNNILLEQEVHNVFGVIKGFTDPDRYVVLGAQRDAWGPGFARANVGTSLLVELARVIHGMVEKEQFRPRRSLLFASWSAGDYGSVGATEWLESYMSLDRKAFSYISLDGVVTGLGSFTASTSPLLQNLLESTMKEVKSPFGSGSLYNMMGNSSWTKVLRPMAMEDPAYPFLASFGIPSLSFRLTSGSTEPYQYYGTALDTKGQLDEQTNHRSSELAALAAQVAGLLAVRLVHDPLLRLDVSSYAHSITTGVATLYRHILALSQSGRLTGLNPNWLSQARGSFLRAAAAVNSRILSTDLSDPEACRILNDRLMRVEPSLLSPYVSRKDAPFRHLLFGHGPHTLQAIYETSDMEHLRLQLGLTTWTLQGVADAMMPHIWNLDNDF